ncbi:hypothetical protein MMC30_009383 [Trapelia coarctata]|nr:hypothetical protein [Trapelia coarctata]
MYQSLLAATLFFHLPLHSTAQIISTTSDLGILQLVTPTTHASLVPATALAALSADAFSFCSSYIDIDTFNIGSAIGTAIASVATIPHAGVSLVAQEHILLTVYFDATTSLLNKPTEYLTRLSSAASPWPFSSALMSQASGILLGYESLVSRDVLNLTPTGPSITPGISISVATGATGATATTQSTASSKAGGVPAATANVQLAFTAVVAAAGVVGMVVL